MTPNVVHAAPPARDWTHPDHAPQWRMFRNDEIGDCTVASRAHLLQCEAVNAGRSISITDDDVASAYSAVTGYDPDRPETDQGAQMIDVLKFMRQVGLAGTTIGAFAAVETGSRIQVETAINAFGGLWAGIDLPISAQTQTVWDVAPPDRRDASHDRNSWGGHAVAVIGYQRTGLTFVTWGAIKTMTWEFLMSYCSEGWATIDALWLRDDGLTPSGFDAALMAADLAAVSSA